MGRINQQRIELLLNSKAVKQKAIKNMVMQKYRINGAAICGHYRMQSTGSGAKEKLPCKTMDLSAPVCYTETGLNKAQIVYKVK